MPSDVHQPPQSLDFRHRAELTEKMDEPCSRDELRACLQDLARLNSWFFTQRQLLAWLDSFVPPSAAPPLHILDVGCGNGDILRRVDRWAKTRGLDVKLTGIDINPDTVAIAAEATPPASHIQWVSSDVFAYTPDTPIDIVVSALVTHHLSDNDVIRFLQWMERNATLGWFINDLSRAAIPYHFLRIFTKLAGLHPFVQNDAPVSVARAFVSEDWRVLCAAAGLGERDVSIQDIRPARICVCRRKPR
jgi:2-polyprenyl-3-methyl-5-hydroxy-6-metoxy-1,4-benzoquinol methylase